MTSKLQQGFRNATRKDQLINEQRKKLEELRLQTESENTKLLKIQQKEREVEADYQNQKQNMQQTLAKLALQAQNFMKQQVKTTHEFESQKQQIFANDRKKQAYLKQKEELETRNKKRNEEIKEKQQKLASKKEKLAHIRSQIKRHQIFEDFLKEVKGLSEDFNTGQFDQFSVMTILQRYRTMQKKKKQLFELHKTIQSQKQSKSKAVMTLKKKKQQQILEYTSKIKELKDSIDAYNQENVQLQSELQGKLNQNGQKQRQLGQIIFSIRGLYLSIAGEQKQKLNKTTLQMLETIKQERKKLKEYLDLFNKKIAEEKSKQ